MNLIDLLHKGGPIVWVLAAYSSIGLAIVIEGLIYAAFPAQARAVWEMIANMPEQRLRAIGLVAALMGIGLIWLVRG